MSCKPRQLNKFISLVSVSLGGMLSFGVICAYRGDETFYSKILMPFVTKYIDPELAHEACIFLTRHRLIQCRDSLTEEQARKLETNVFNISFRNPIGIAAGFDKNSLAARGLSQYGVGFTEVGTVTPMPQNGNPKKRIFRILSDQALINRCGFNNRGMDFVVDNLNRQEIDQPMLIGLNIGKNKHTSHPSSDYLIGLEKAQNVKSIDYIVINISSPNTPGLRDLQAKKNLEQLLDDVLTKMDNLSITKPLLVKIAPDLSDDQIKDVADILMRKKCGQKKVDGVILTNTTLIRPPLDKQGFNQEIFKEIGGLSGRPLKELSTRTISRFYHLTKGQIPIIGVGGIHSGQDAYEKIRAGASLIQLYTSLTYEGPPVINRIKKELVDLLERDKLTSIADAVGLDHRKVP